MSEAVRVSGAVWSHLISEWENPDLGLLDLSAACPAVEREEEIGESYRELLVELLLRAVESRLGSGTVGKTEPLPEAVYFGTVRLESRAHSLYAKAVFEVLKELGIYLPDWSILTTVTDVEEEIDLRADRWALDQRKRELAEWWREGLITTQQFTKGVHDAEAKIEGGAR